MENQKQKRRVDKQEWVRYCIYIVLILSIALSFVIYKIISDREIFSRNQKYTQASAISSSDAFGIKLQTDMSLCYTYADSVSHILSGKDFSSSDRAFMFNYLKNITNTGIFDFVGLVTGVNEPSFDAVGTWQPNETTPHGLAYGTVSVSEYYRKGMGFDLDVEGVRFGRSGLYYVGESIGNLVKGSFMYFSPVGLQKSDYQDGGVLNPIGVLGCVLSPKTLSGALKTKYMGETGRVVVADEQGNFMAGSSELQTNNLRELIEKNNKTELADDVLGRLEKLTDDQCLSFSYRCLLQNKDCTGVLIKFTAVGKPWILLSTFPDGAIENLSGTLSNSVMILISSLAAEFAIGFLVLLWGSRQNRARLNRSNERLKLLIDELPGLVVEMTVGNTEINVEGNAFNFYAIDNGQYDLTDFYKIVNADDREHLTEAYDLVLKKDEPVVQEIRLLDKSGDYVWCSFTLRKTKNKRAETELIGIASSVDLQKRQVTEQEHLFSAMSFAYHRMSYVDFDEGRYTQLQFDELSKDLAVEGDLSQLLTFMTELCDEKERFDVSAFIESVSTKQFSVGQYDEIEYQLKSGKWERMIFVVISDQAEKAHTGLFAIQDVTEQKEKELRTCNALEEAYEAAQNASQAKTAFLSRMSHDIRTPMNAILGMTFLARQKLDDKTYVQSCLDKIMISGNRLLALLNEVLDISRIEAQSSLLSPEPTRITQQMKELEYLAKTLADAHGHTLTMTVGEIARDYVMCDCARLQQILINFISNAVKYTPNGGEISIGVSEIRTDDERAYFSFSVQDNGIGMTPDQTKNAFEPFYRADDSRISKIEGTGLGMSIAVNLARLMNGDIDLKSELGKGTTVSLLVGFPICEQCEDLDAATKDEPIPNFEDFNLKGTRILVVEDNELNREIAKELIEMTGATVETAVNGQEAVKAIASRDVGYFSLVFMDIQMPVCNGYEATVQIRSMPRADALTLPIVAMTANAFTNDVADAKRAGMNGHLAKPIDLAHLMYLLKKYCGQKTKGTGAEDSAN